MLRQSQEIPHDPEHPGEPSDLTQTNPFRSPTTNPFAGIITNIQGSDSQLDSTLGGRDDVVIGEGDDPDELEDLGDLLFTQPPVIRFTLMQRVGQEFFRYEGALMFGLFVGQYIPPIPTPFNGMMETAVLNANGIVGDVLSAGVSRPDPIAGLRAAGGNHAGRGFVKVGHSHFMSLTAMAGAGYGVGVAVVKFTPILLASQNPAAQGFGLVLSADAFRVPLVATLGYLGGRSIYAIGIKTWDCCIPGEAERMNDEDVYLMQRAGQYALRWLGDVAFTESVLLYLNIAGTAAAAEPLVQITILMSYDVAKQLGTHFSFSPHPIDSLVPHWDRDTMVDQETQEEVLMPVTEAQRRKWTLGRSVVYFGVVGATYAIGAITCAMAESMGSGVCKEDTTANRMIRYSAVLGIPLAIDYALTHVGVPLVRGIASCWSNMFSRAPSGYQPVPQQEERQQHDSTPTLRRSGSFSS